MAGAQNIGLKQLIADASLFDFCAAQDLTIQDQIRTKGQHRAAAILSTLNLSDQLPEGTPFSDVHLKFVTNFWNLHPNLRGTSAADFCLLERPGETDVARTYCRHMRAILEYHGMTTIRFTEQYGTVVPIHLY